LGLRPDRGRNPHATESVIAARAVLVFTHRQRERGRMTIRMITRCLVTAGLAGTLLGGTVHAAPTPGAPIAQIRPVQDSFGPATLIDHYRWMEATPNPELDAYIKQYTAFTAATLARLPDRAQIASEITALSAATTQVEQVVPDGDTVFYLKRGPADDVARLMQRNAAGGEENLLVDPEALQDAPMHARITAISPSPDGNYVAFVLQPGGPETAELRVHDVVRNTNLAEHLPGAGFANVSWRPDSTGFYYAGVPDGQTALPPPARFAHIKVYLHRLGNDTSHDVAVLDSDHLPFAFHGAPNIFPRIILPMGSDNALAIVSDGISPEIAVYTVPVAELAMAPAPWKPVAPQGTGVMQVTVSGAIAFLLTSKDAPSLKVLTEDLADSDPGAARVVLPEASGVITSIAAAADALYVARREGAATHLLRLGYNDSTPQEVRLPFDGNIAPPLGEAGALTAEPRDRGAYFGVESWTHPLTWLRYDGRLLRAVDMQLVPPYTRDLSAYRTIETTAKGADGVNIPLSLIMRNDTVPDHLRPALVETYGAFGYSYYPRFVPGFLPFVDHGGVLAIAHIRGGGELGEAWHQAGRLGNRPNAVNDLIACAQALVKLGYTDNAHLAASGTGAGVLAVGGAITKQPDLFRAALLRGGLPNPVRGGGVADADLNTAEFGGLRNPAQLPGLLAMDPYQNIRDGAEYPAILLTGTQDDARAPAWQQAKMAARLQAASTSGRPILLSILPEKSATRASITAWQADEIAFLLWQLSGGATLPAQPPAAAKPKAKTWHKHSPQ
jgi:prolyl oligopeptidase